MSARDLVGRPLVPFFDAHDNVNETLEVDAHANEQLDVDARVWDKELGYFVYPNEANGSSAPATSGHSMPIPIKKAAPSAAAQDGGSGSFGKMLLTPDMLSRSAPSASGSGMQHLHNTMGMTHAVDHHVPPANNEETTPRAATPRSASAKRASRQKSSSSTPNRNARNKQRNNGAAQPQQPQQQAPQSTSDGGSSGGEDRTASDSSEKTKNGKKNSRKSRNKQPQTPQKTKEGDLSANGKWAWSAFQSSPDPKSLPLPPFVAGPGGSPGMGALPPPMDPPKIEERLDPPPPPLFPGRPPSMPPDASTMAMMGMAPPLPPPHPTSLEHSMTQDLRRMLNIGS